MQEAPVCSAKGCRVAAAYAVVWNNPTLHTPDREKVWHACADHVSTLSEFVDVRGFLRRVDTLPEGLLAETPEEAPEDPALPG